MYGPYGMYGGMPPYGSPQMHYIPCPPDASDKVVKILRHLEKKKLRDARRKEEEEKKNKEKSAPKPITFTLAQVFVFVMLFGVPVGMANLYWLSLLKEALVNFKW
jgi:hypothetical protein